MTTLSSCLKGLAVVALIAASPVFIIFAAPFGYGMATDVLNTTGTAAALAVTTGICLAALAWTRYRGRFTRLAMPKRRVVRSLG
jgi:hypothetical protein